MTSNDYKKYEPFFENWYFENDNSKIGSGSYGSVFRVVRHDINVEPSALKIISIPKERSEIDTRRSEGMNDAAIRNYYKRKVNDIKKEFILMSQLKGCNNIVSCEDFQEYQHKDGFGYDIAIRMELLDPLVKYEQDHEIDQSAIIKLGIDMCNALERCAFKNIIHRDIKPDNIFVSELGDFKLGDFGIARTLEDTDLILSARRGTPNYMAPEVFAAKPYDRTADIYSLGIVLYRTLNDNRLPFLPPPPNELADSDYIKAFNRRISGESIPRPQHGDEALKSIVLKACAFRQKNRYQHPREMREHLEMVRSVLESGQKVSPEFIIDLDATIADTGQKQKVVRKKTAVKTAAAAGIAALTIGAGAWFIGLKDRNQEVPAQNISAQGMLAQAEKESDQIQTNDTVSNGGISGEGQISENQDEREPEDKQDDKSAITELKADQVKDFSKIAEYVNVKKLDLSESDIKDLSFLESLTQLKELNLSYTNVEDLSALEKCSNLKSLDLSYNNENLNNKEVISQIASLKGLEQLNLTGNLAVGEFGQALKKLENLKELYVGNTGIESGSWLKGMKNLQVLDLQGNILFDDLSSIKPLKKIHTLNLSVTGVTNIQDLKQMKQLKNLDLSVTDISDLSVLKNLPHLEEVKLTDSAEIKKQVKTLKKQLKNCEFIYS